MVILLELLLEVGSVPFAKSLLHPQFGLEAEVGIEPVICSPAESPITSSRPRCTESFA